MVSERSTQADPCDSCRYCRDWYCQTQKEESWHVLRARAETQARPAPSDGHWRHQARRYTHVHVYSCFQESGSFKKMVPLDRNTEIHNCDI